jgi:hypothetical protein
MTLQHPTTEELLSMRDGFADVRWLGHLDECPACAARAQELALTRQALRALPPLEPKVSWAQLASRLHAHEQPRRARQRRTVRWLAGAALAASVALVAVLVALDRPQQTPMRSPETFARAPQATAEQADLASLIERARTLEALLQTIPERPRVERVDMAATLDSMEERIQWLDYQLSYAGPTVDPAQVQRLWRERVELMDSLVQVRYAQARTAF